MNILWWYYRFLIITIMSQLFMQVWLLSGWVETEMITSQTRDLYRFPCLWQYLDEIIYSKISGLWIQIWVKITLIILIILYYSCYNNINQFCNWSYHVNIKISSASVILVRKNDTCRLLLSFIHLMKFVDRYMLTSATVH